MISPSNMPTAEVATALVKLFRDNASTLTPDRIHSAFFDSHPPALERIGRLNALSVYPLKLEPQTAMVPLCPWRRCPVAAHAPVRRAAVDQRVAIADGPAGRSSTRASFRRVDRGVAKRIYAKLGRCSRDAGGGDPHAPRPLRHGRLDRRAIQGASVDEPAGYLTCRLMAADTGVPHRPTDCLRPRGWDEEAIERYKEKFGSFGEMIHPLPDSYRRSATAILSSSARTIGRWSSAAATPRTRCLYCAN